MGKMDLSSTMILIQLLALVLSACTSVQGRFKIHTATSVQNSHQRRLVKCDNSSRLLIRTAYYVVTSHAPRFTPCRDDECYQEMTSQDLIKLYSHCRRHRPTCDVSEAGVDRPFEISYFCLYDDHFDPCVNKTLDVKPGTPFSFYLDDARLEMERDATCECTMTAFGNVTTVVRAMTLLGGGPVSAVPTADGAESKFGQDRDWLQDSGDGSREAGLRFDDGKWQWGPREGGLPVEWQLKTPDTDPWMPLTVTWTLAPALDFGLTWVYVDGQYDQVVCSSTWIPEPAAPVTKAVPTKPGMTRWLLVYTAVAGSVAVVLVVAVIVLTVNRCRNRSAYRLKSGVTGGEDGEKEPAHVEMGDYCSIQELATTNTPGARHHTTHRQTPFCHTEASSRGQVGPLQANSSSAAGVGTYPNAVTQVDDSCHYAVSGQLSTCDGGYELLRRQTSSPWEDGKGERGEGGRGSAVYDHTLSPTPSADPNHDQHYQLLDRHRHNEIRVVDNVYDVTSPVTSEQGIMVEDLYAVTKR